MSTVTSRKSKKHRRGKKRGGQKVLGKKAGKGSGQVAEAVIERDSSDECFSDWARSLATRESLFALVQRSGAGKQPPLLWGVSRDTPVTEASRLLAQYLWQIQRGKETCEGEELAARALEWCEFIRMKESRRESKSRFPGGAQEEVSDGSAIGLALESLAWAHLMPDLARVLSRTDWWGVLDHLISIAAEAGAVPVGDSLWRPQLLAGELPLTLAYLFPEIPDCQCLVTDAIQLVSQGIDDLLDGEGMIHADHLAWQRVLGASWTRCLLLDKHLPGKKRRISKESRLQFEWLVRNMLRLTRADGSQGLGSMEWSRAERVAYREMMEVALRITKDKEDRVLGKVVFGKARRWPEDLLDDYELPADPGCQSEWAEWAVLQPDWSPLSPRLVIRFAHRTLQVELSSMNRTLVSGAFDPEIRIDAELLEPQADWEVVCWETDDDIDFIELEMRYGDGWRIQRQLLMAREDMFLLMADAILGEDSGRIAYQQVFPLVAGTTFVGAEETREGSLKADKRLAQMLPLSLPEWRTDHRFGSFKLEDDELVLRQHREGTALHAALFIDLHPGRQRKRITWRSLTVAEQLEIVSPDVAVAYRVQVAGEQWVCYRSLGEKANRTFLGQNYSSESVTARFLEDGTAEDLIEIEG